VRTDSGAHGIPSYAVFSGVAASLFLRVMNTKTWFSRLGVEQGSDNLSSKNITCLETWREGNRGPILSCGRIEQEEVLLTGTALINVTVFVVSCLLIRFVLLTPFWVDRQLLGKY